MQIQNNALPPLILWYEPRAGEQAEVMVADIDITPVDGFHQLAKLVLTLARDLQRAVGDKGLEEIQLGTYQLRRETQMRPLLFMRFNYYTIFVGRCKHGIGMKKRAAAGGSCLRLFFYGSTGPS